MGEQKSDQSRGHNRLLLPVLGLSVLSTWLVTIIFQLLMIDIAHSFNVQVGTASMAASVGSVSGIIFGLLMAFVNVRFNHKLLLLGGLVATTVGTLGYYFSPNFLVLMASNIGVGGGIAIVTAMAYSIIGDVYSLEKRGRAIGIIVASVTLASVIGAPLAGLLATYGDWRMVVISLALPVVLSAFLLSALVIPKNRTTTVNPTIREPFSVGCKAAFSSTQTVAALLATMLMFCEGSIGYYSVSFFRNQFNMSIEWGSTFVLVASIVAALGGVVAGLMVHRVGRRRLGIVAIVAASALTVVFTFLPTVELSGLFGILRYWFAAMASTAASSLIIEQLPKFRATMMSLNTAFMNVGMLVASLVGGFALNNFGYQVLGLVLGSLGLLGTVVWVTLVKEPSATTKKAQ